MQAWAPIPDDEVAERGPLYDSYIVQERQIVEDVSEYPLEEHLYTEDGQRVERQRPIPAPDGHRSSLKTGVRRIPAFPRAQVPTKD